MEKLATHPRRDRDVLPLSVLFAQWLHVAWWLLGSLKPAAGSVTDLAQTKAWATFATPLHTSMGRAVRPLHH